MKTQITKKRGINTMAKGHVGVPTSSVIRFRRKPIHCDCERCKHYKKQAGTYWCTEYDRIKPNETKCQDYVCVRPSPKKNKVRAVNKKRKNKRGKKQSA